MDHGKDWRIVVEERDALLFALQPDGTMTMRALPITEWETRRAETEVAGSRQTVAELVRRMVNPGEVSTVMADTPSAARSGTT